MGPVNATDLFDPPSDDLVPVDREMLAAAYWSGRGSIPTADAQHVLSLLSRLAAIDGSMSEWNMVDNEGESVALAGGAAGVAEQMAEQTKMAEIAPGVSVMLACPGAAIMRVRIGIPLGAGTNFVALLPGPPDVDRFWLTKSSLLLDALVETFDPDTAVVGSSRHREAQPRVATVKQNWIGAITYATAMPESNGIPMSKLGYGKVIDLTDGGQRLPTTNEALKVYGALYGADD